MAEMRRLTAYFGALRKGNTWENMEPVFEDLFHKDVELPGKQSTFDYESWKKQCQGFLSRGVSFDMEKLVKDGDEIVYTVTIREGQTALRHTAKGIFKDGKMIRTEPVDPSIYDRISKSYRKPVQIL